MANKYLEKIAESYSVSYNDGHLRGNTKVNLSPEKFKQLQTNTTKTFVDRFPTLAGKAGIEGAILGGSAYFAGRTGILGRSVAKHSGKFGLGVGLISADKMLRQDLDTIQNKEVNKILNKD